ncbi:MAG: DUF2442 domain-containing protein [Anaerolineae bacterium]
MPQRQNDKLVWNDEHPQVIVVRSFERIGGYGVRMRFSNGQVKEIDLEQFLHGPVFDPLVKSQALFDTMHLDGGTIAWDNGADIAPETLYEDSRPVKVKRNGKTGKRAVRAARRPTAKATR